MDADNFTNSNFISNLKLAVSYHPSISEVCRKLDINRQQFMKYLGGGAFPSQRNLRRICDFFGFDEYELLMPHDQFRNILRLRPKRENDVKLPPHVADILMQGQRSRAALLKTHGYYYMYYHAFSRPGHILRSLVLIYGWHDYTLYKRLERLKKPDSSGQPDVYKYAGIVTVAGDRMHMIDRETITRSDHTHTILYMNYRNRMSLLTGLIMGVSGSDTHEPSAARTALEYVGKAVNLKRAIAGCRVYPESSPEISAAIRSNLSGGQENAGPLKGVPF